jgi:hypothetical protein
VYYTPFFCRHLDVRSRLCTVYADRQRVNPDCVGVARGIERGIFPADCPYTAGVAGYRPPVEDLDFFGLGALARDLARELDIPDAEFERVRDGGPARGGTEAAGDIGSRGQFRTL